MNSILIKALQKLIKPCPCCGGKDVYFKIIDEKTQQDVSNKLDTYKQATYLKEQVGCFTCGLNMQKAEGCQAINQWNNRVT